MQYSLAVDLEGLNVIHIQIFHQVGIRAQVGGQGPHHFVGDPRIVVGGTDGVDGENVRQRVGRSPRLNFLHIVVPGGVHRLQTDAEFLLQHVAHRVIAHAQRRFHVPMGDSDGHGLIRQREGVQRQHHHEGQQEGQHFFHGDPPFFLFFYFHRPKGGQNLIP